MTSATLDRTADHRRGADPESGRTVVVGHDGSAAGMAAVAFAGRRAGPRGHVIVVHALPLGVPPEAVERGNYASAVASLLREIEGSVPDGPSYETRVVVGLASKAVLDAAQRSSADEIVLGAAANRRARGAIGRVSEAVLRQADTPVTIVPLAPSRLRPE